MSKVVEVKEKIRITHSQILKMVEDGCSKKEIAEFFNISQSVLKEGLDKFNIDIAKIKYKPYIFIDDITPDVVTKVSVPVKSVVDDVMAEGVPVSLSEGKTFGIYTPSNTEEVPNETFKSDSSSIFDAI